MTVSVTRGHYASAARLAIRAERCADAAWGLSGHYAGVYCQGRLLAGMRSAEPARADMSSVLLRARSAGLAIRALCLADAAYSKEGRSAEAAADESPRCLCLPRGPFRLCLSLRSFIEGPSIPLVRGFEGPSISFATPKCSYTGVEKWPDYDIDVAAWV